MGGMPSARGTEWKGREEARKKFDDNYGKINWKDTEVQHISEIHSEIPASCKECIMLEHCPTEISHGSEKCKKRWKLKSLEKEFK